MIIVWGQVALASVAEASEKHKVSEPTSCARREHFGRLKAVGGLGEVAGGGVSGVGHPSGFSRTL